MHPLDFVPDIVRVPRLGRLFGVFRVQNFTIVIVGQVSSVPRTFPDDIEAIRVVGTSEHQGIRRNDKDL